MKKFKLTTEHKINWFGRTLYRIKACVSFTTIDGFEVKAGDLGGFVEKESNLSHNGKAWIFDDAKIWGNAKICGNAEIWGNAEICGNAEIFDDAKIWGNAEIWGNAKICGNAEIWGNAEICGNAEIFDDAKIWGNAEIFDDAKICGNAKIWGNAKICGNAEIFSVAHTLVIGSIGSRSDFTTFFRDKDNEITVKCGCFLGKMDNFLEKVTHTHGNNKHALVYRAAVEVAKLQIDLTERSNEIE